MSEVGLPAVTSKCLRGIPAMRLMKSGSLSGEKGAWGGGGGRGGGGEDRWPVQQPLRGDPLWFKSLHSCTRHSREIHQMRFTRLHKWYRAYITIYSNKIRQSNKTNQMYTYLTISARRPTFDFRIRRLQTSDSDVYGWSLHWKSKTYTLSVLMVVDPLHRYSNEAKRANFDRERQRRPFNTKAGQRRPFNTKAGQRRPFNTKAGQRRPFTPRWRYFIFVMREIPEFATLIIGPNSKTPETYLNPSPDYIFYNFFISALHTNLNFLSETVWVCQQITHVPSFRIRGWWSNPIRTVFVFCNIGNFSEDLYQYLYTHHAIVQHNFTYL